MSSFFDHFKPSFGLFYLIRHIFQLCGWCIHFWFVENLLAQKTVPTRFEQFKIFAHDWQTPIRTDTQGLWTCLPWYRFCTDDVWRVRLYSVTLVSLFRYILKQFFFSPICRVPVFCVTFFSQWTNNKQIN